MPHNFIISKYFNYFNYTNCSKLHRYIFELIETYLPMQMPRKQVMLRGGQHLRGMVDDSQKRRDEALPETEIMFLNFYQQGHLSQSMGQALMNML